MNQILLTNNQNNKKKNNKYSGSNSSDMKKIIIFFSIAILIFAMLIIGLYAYKVFKSDKDNEEIGKPELSLEQMDNQVKIIAKAESGINKIIYTWNDDEPKEVEMNGRTDHEEALEIPEGENNLNVKVIDQNGEEIETNQEFYIEEDKEKPKIALDEAIGNGKVKITATDENNTLKYITYKWNDEQETTIEAEEENQTVIEVTIDVKRGKNTLKITAVNGLAKEQTLEKIFNGVNNPVIEVTRKENELHMKMTHDMGFKKIEFEVNGQQYVYDENFSGYNPEQKEISYKFDLKDGENIVIIHAISTEDTEVTYKGKCNYTAE